MKHRASFTACILAVLGFSLTTARAGDALNFRTGILPVLTKAGCNTGACHGAATGRGGFKLSLLGYDPDEDFYRITRERAGRRVALDSPESSLLLRKPSKQVAHEGGRKLPADSAGYTKIKQWIAAGAPLGARDLSVTSISVQPPETLLPEPRGSFPLLVTAQFSDGTSRDVTALALYSSNDDAIATTNAAGSVTVSGRGATSIMVRYSGQVAAARLTVPFGTAETEVHLPDGNLIDKHIGAELRKLRLPVSPVSRDGEFLRRIHLDLTGRLPSLEQARAFLTKPSTPESRREVINRLIGSPDFVDLWTMHFADLLLIGGRRNSGALTDAWHQWVRTQWDNNRPFDQFVSEIITASGPLHGVPPTNFFMLASDPRDQAEHTARIFLGIQIGCARCHAHPADRWTQDDHCRFSACFARISREDGMIKAAARGEVEHPGSGEPVAPGPPGTASVFKNGAEERRADLAAWMISPDNPWFSRCIVNRVWKHLMGRGLVEPVDDLRSTNPATHPALLDALAKDFTTRGFNLQHLIRTIVSSQTWQLTSRVNGPNKDDDRFYSHALIKELPAQVYMDIVAQVTGVDNEFPGADQFIGPHRGVRAVEIPTVSFPSYALDVLGRCSREASCDLAARNGGGMAKALHLINGSTINDKMQAGIARKLATEKQTDRAIIEELHLRTLTRFPTDKELTAWTPLPVEQPARTESIQDLLWALLNSREFTFNH